jgi:hypothetical protein
MEQFSRSSGFIALLDLVLNLTAICGQAYFLFREHKDGLLDELVNARVRAALNVLSD